MPDREKVIGHFQDAIATSWDLSRWGFVRVDVIKDAIALLQEQEPVEPSKPGTAYKTTWSCGVCAYPISTAWVACPSCGKKVKWE